MKVPACFTFITVPTLYSHSLSPWLNSTPFSTLVLIAIQFKEVWWNQASFPPPTELSVAQVCVFTTCAVCMLVCGLSSSCEYNQMCFWSCVCMHVCTLTTMNVAFLQSDKRYETVREKDKQKSKHKWKSIKDSMFV